MPSRFPLTALLLAGGRSLRMGQDKTLLPHEGASLRSFMSARLEALFEETLLCGPGGVPDRHPGIGPLGGLEAGMRAASHDWRFVVGCDMPHFSAELLAELWREAQVAGADAILPQGPRGFEPLHSLVHRRALPAIERAISNGCFGMEQALRAARARVLPWDRVRKASPDGGCFRNWNFPSDLPRATREALAGTPR